MPKNLQRERSVLESRRTMHWFHWLIVLLSLLVTVGAWYIAQQQYLKKNSLKFEREVSKIKSLITERMQKYEDALSGAVAFIQTYHKKLDHQAWQQYTSILDIKKKYPGINGIGVILHIDRQHRDVFLREEQQKRKDFRIHPTHKKDRECLPIVFIEPVDSNRQAIGLDMAHEDNRYSSAMKAIESGKPKITAPIVLVQDAYKTPGFLFYMPYYNKGKNRTVQQRKDNIIGMVYAAFVAKNLMLGVLAKEYRYVTIRISDGETVLYDEHAASEEKVLFQNESSLILYGRKWNFDIRSNKIFHREAASDRPIFILIAGIIIDTILLILFISLSKAHSRALNYGDALHHNLSKKQKQLQQANNELIEFNYQLSHNLIAPLKTINGYVYLAQCDVEDGNFNTAATYFSKIKSQADKLKLLTGNLSEISFVDSLKLKREEINISQLMSEMENNLSDLCDTYDVEITTISNAHTTFYSDLRCIKQILRSLITNGIKFSDKNSTNKFVHVIFEMDTENIYIKVKDNGVGIPEKYRNKIFRMFSRANQTSDGYGLGTYMAKKCVDLLDGTIHFTCKNKQTIFVVTIPRKELG